MKINKKGFTLIELLGVIAVVSLVFGISIYGIGKIIENTKAKAAIISIAGIEKAASTYSGEADYTNWQIKDKKEYFCITIGELVNKGMLKKDAINGKDKYDMSNYVAVVKDYDTKVLEKSKLILNDDNNSTEYQMCTGTILGEGEIATLPTIKDKQTYTDEIDILEFTDGSTNLSNKVVDGSRKCFYGETSSNINRSDNVIVNETGHTCNISKLPQNTTYYVKVCMSLTSGAYLCSEPESIKTKTITKPAITINSSNLTATIAYSGNNINGNHYNYLKSPIKGTTDKNIILCSEENNKITCSGEETKSIIENKWYKVGEDTITITYSEGGIGSLKARTYDKTNNYSEVEKELKIHKIEFKKGTADKIGGKEADVTKRCLAEGNNGCNITSPTIERENYYIVGWNTTSTALTSTWDVNTINKVTDDATYYPIMLKKINAPTTSFCKDLNYNESEQVLVSDASEGFTWDSGTKRIDAGSQDVFAKLKDGYIWNDETKENKKITCSIKKVDATCPTISGYSAYYDGAYHSINISGGSGGTIKYSTDNSTWTETNPTRIDIGTTTVYVKIVGDINHNDKTCGNASIVINQRPSSHYYYDDDEPTNPTKPTNPTNPTTPSCPSGYYYDGRCIGGCFLPGTKVSTLTGLKDIDKIVIGDMVLSYNEELNKNEYKEVANVFIHEKMKERLYTLYIEKDNLKVTEAHRFYIKRNNKYSWIAARDLKVGDYVRYSDGTYHKIKKINYELQTNTVYNIAVKDNHNYYVGNMRVLVHNEKREDKKNEEGGQPTDTTGCFLAETKVITQDGYKDIDKLKVGDYILTYNEKIRKNEYNKVLEVYTFNNLNEKLYTLTFDDSTSLQVTSTHRFYIKRRGTYLWMPTKGLKIGDLVRYSNGIYHRLTNRTYEKLSETVYNVNVEHTHNFYVGEQQILVHNAKCSTLGTSCGEYK